MGDPLRPFARETRDRRRLIGIELRLVAPHGEQREVVVFPLDIEIPSGFYGSESSFNVTVHTDAGDATSANTRLP